MSSQLVVSSGLRAPGSQEWHGQVICGGRALLNLVNKQAPKGVTSEAGRTCGVLAGG